jgi:hypothetical protein
MSGHFALSLNGALKKLLFTWGARITWNAQRQHASQILNDMDSFFANASFLFAYDQEHVSGEPVLPSDFHPNAVPNQGGDFDLSFN